MTLVHLFALAGGILFFFCSLFLHKNCKYSISFLAGLLIAVAMVLRICLAYSTQGFGNDIACFAAWAERIYNVGPGQFYSSEVFSDYPPGYLYLLYPIGLIRNLLQLEYYAPMHLLLIKTPAILFDLLTAVMLYRLSVKKLSGAAPLALLAVYLFNPAFVINSSMWGQVDSVYSFFLLVMLWGLSNYLPLLSIPVFCIGILIKPQMLIFAPILLIGLIDYLIAKHFNRKAIGQMALCSLLSLLGTVLLVLPFGFENVWHQYFDTISSYPYAAINAYNFWGLLGKNWVNQSETFLGISYQAYGTIFLILIVAVVLFLGIKIRNSNKYYFLAAILMTAVFLFSVRMHERYLYPGLLLLLFSYIYYASGTVYKLYGAISVLWFYNVADVLFFYDPQNYDRKSSIIMLTSMGMMICFLFLSIETYRYYKRSGILPDCEITPMDNEPKRDTTSPITHLTRIDIVILLVVTLLYSIIALYDLGDRQAPETVMNLNPATTINLQFSAHSPVALRYYIAPPHSRSFSMQTDVNTEVAEITFDNVFTWKEIELEAGIHRLTLTLNQPEAAIIELCFVDDSGNSILPDNASDYTELFDEQGLCPVTISFRNSMYFDEIYHGRTAYEFINGLQTYETTHPPLGKIFIALGVLLFGMNPFGWRIIGVLFGIAMLPAIYIFAKKIFGRTPLAATAILLFAFDFMHFTQTRIATIDVYITFFVLLQYFFLYLFYSTDFTEQSKHKTYLILFCCGLCMGLGIACKWTGIYSGMGLAVLFFYCLGLKYIAVRKDVLARKSYMDKVIQILLFCIPAFVLVPMLIYLLSYIPFVDGSNDGILTRLIHNQEYILWYHSTLTATHPYSSGWFDWPIIRRPIWYYSRIVTGTSGSGGIREGISAFGNPLVWWLGIPAFLYNLVLSLRKKDRTATFLVVGYLAQYLPWFFVTRATFIYHYFPSTIFVILMIVYAIKKLENKLSAKAFYSMLTLYLVGVIALFVLFYPVLSGQPVDADYVTRYLRWFNSWVLAAK